MKTALTVHISDTAARLLDELADAGIYGASRAEVAERFIDVMLANFVEEPTLHLDQDSRTAAGFLVEKEHKET